MALLLLKRVLLLTGNPGIGKTTVLTLIAEFLTNRGVKVGGMTSREVRANGVRIGFEIVSFPSLKRGWLAQANRGNGPQVGKYSVNIADLEAIGAESIIQAVKDCNAVVIDEIGPMSFFQGSLGKLQFQL